MVIGTASAYWPPVRNRKRSVSCGQPLTEAGDPALMKTRRGLS